MVLREVRLSRTLTLVADVVFGRFVWSDSKAKYNLKAHGVSFREAAKVFENSEDQNLTKYDLEHSDDEDRWVTIGCLELDVIFVVWTERVYESADGRLIERIRLISARKAEWFEIEEWNRNNGKV